MKKIKLLLFFITLFLTQIIVAQTTLSAGDIAILQYNSDGSPEVIKFIALTSIESGTTINFTDNGWRSDNTFRANEGTDTWTAASDISCGQIVTITLSSIAFNANGDQVLAYQGLSTSPTFLFAINNEGSGVWQTTATNSRTSALPTGLTNGVNAVALNEIDNTKYTGSLSGSKSTILSNIANLGNWTGSNTVVQNFTGTFTSNLTWSGSGSADDYFNVIINANYNTSSNGSFSTCNCTVNSGNTLTINSSGTVTVEEDIINNGSILVESGGSVVQILSSGSASGTGYTVERTSTSQLEEGNYTYWSSPLASSTLANVADAQRYFSFTASSQSWIAASSGTSMSSGVGYISTGETSITYPSSYTASFSGSAFNTGNINTSVSLGTATFVGADDNWNLLGNPYPSAIDSELFTADNTNLNGTIYYWTHATADSAGDNIQADYAMYNTSGGTGGASQYIASGQGFFIQANTGGTVTFTNAMRVAGNNSTFYKSRTNRKKIEQKDRIWLSLKTKNIKNQILVGFFDEACDDVDRLYDGLKLDSGNKTNFYSLINDKPYGIQGLSPLKRKKNIPLGFSTSIPGTFNISIDNLEGKLKNAQITLHDKLLNIMHQLDKSDYEFLLNKSDTGVFKDRFELIINPQRIFINGEVKKINIYKNGVNLYLDSLEDEDKLQRVSIYSLRGQIYYDKIINDFEVAIKLNSLNKKRIYILKIELSSGEIIIKKMIF